MSFRRLPYFNLTVAFSAAAFICTACVKGNPAFDTSDPGFPYGPVGLNPSQAVAYVQDIKPIFDRDCIECHGFREAEGGYAVNTYALTIEGQRAGDARSSVVVDTAPGGSMYQYFSGDATSKATLVFRWVVVNNLMQTR
jgi:hypothetical protein